jgi:hypothetical protein
VKIEKIEFKAMERKKEKKNELFLTEEGDDCPAEAYHPAD